MTAEVYEERVLLSGPDPGGDDGEQAAQPVGITLLGGDDKVQENTKFEVDVTGPASTTFTLELFHDGNMKHSFGTFTTGADGKVTVEQTMPVVGIGPNGEDRYDFKVTFGNDSATCAVVVTERMVVARNNVSTYTEGGVFKLNVRHAPDVTLVYVRLERLDGTVVEAYDSLFVDNDGNLDAEFIIPDCIDSNDPNKKEDFRMVVELHDSTNNEDPLWWYGWFDIKIKNTMVNN